MTIKELLEDFEKGEGWEDKEGHTFAKGNVTVEKIYNPFHNTKLSGGAVSSTKYWLHIKISGSKLELTDRQETNLERIYDKKMTQVLESEQKDLLSKIKL